MPENKPFLASVADSKAQIEEMQQQAQALQKEIEERQQQLNDLHVQIEALNGLRQAYGHPPV